MFTLACWQHIKHLLEQQLAPPFVLILPPQLPQGSPYSSAAQSPVSVGTPMIHNTYLFQTARKYVGIYAFCHCKRGFASLFT